jgi:hypothetical protein
MNVVVEVRKKERSGCEKKRTCVTGEEAENALQRTVKQGSRSETEKNAEKISKMGMQAISECIS